MNITSISVHNVVSIKIERKDYGTDAYTFDVTLNCGEHKLVVYSFPVYAAGAYIEPSVELKLGAEVASV